MRNFKNFLLILSSVIPIDLFAGNAVTTFQVSVQVVNPCKIGEYAGKKFLYDCPKKILNATSD